MATARNVEIAPENFFNRKTKFALKQTIFYLKKFQLQISFFVCIISVGPGWPPHRVISVEVHRLFGTLS